MKRLVALLTAGVLLCLIVLAKNTVGQVGDWCCGGGYQGCPYAYCTPGGGNCPNNGPAYNYSTELELTVYSCVPSGTMTCTDSANLPWCNVSPYLNWNMETQECFNPACDAFNLLAPQCVSPDCAP